MADNNMQVIGDKEKLKNEPRTVTPTPFSGGKMQAVGDTISQMKDTPVSMAPKAFAGGTIQKVGSDVALKDTPRHGWQSFDTPMSQRAIKQSK